MNTEKPKHEAAGEEKPGCGLIMPISATANFSAGHWAQVQILLHRAVEAAGFAPHNVWENSAKDRISERIIGNVFKYEIALVDISDLNPNVMIELGLRLASKYPTVVVANEGGVIPFDVRDFEVIFYPKDMNMLGMEDFFDRLARQIQEKSSSYRGGTYVPFLGSVVVEVLSPRREEVPFETMILSRFDELERKISERAPPVQRNTEPNLLAGYARSSRVSMTLPRKNVASLKKRLSNLDGVHIESLRQKGEATSAIVSYPTGMLSEIAREITDLEVGDFKAVPYSREG